MSGLDARQPTDYDWLALCLVTESNRADEWPAIAQVIENRRRTGRWGNTYKSVILARMQFSAFNVFSSGKPDFEWLAKKQGILLLMHAATFAATGFDDLKPGRLWALAISDATLHYYSPVSMRPAGSRPAWAKAAKRIYCPEGIDPSRFQFAESVP